MFQCLCLATRYEKEIVKKKHTHILRYTRRVTKTTTQRPEVVCAEIGANLDTFKNMDYKCELQLKNVP